MIKKYSYSVGLLFIMAGLTGFVIFFVFGYKSEFLNWKVFTIYSQYLATKKFSFITNGQGDELSVLFYSFGWLLLFYHKYGNLKNLPSVLVLIFLPGYLFLHGMAVMVFIFFYLLILPMLLFIYKS